jgi:BirA family transcriptional regulator, biotin operon repressor / biotin---[acetyl-CoA-carboxylase] ligase
MLIEKPPFLIHHFDSIGSTNDYLRDLRDAPEFTVVVADEQTAGKGRRQRVWHSERGAGLYFSILLRPAESAQLVSLVASIAVAEALSSRGVDSVDVKWPNDILVRERKICGILCEAAGSSATGLRVVAGIGINLNHDHFPRELEDSASSILIETGKPIDKMDFLEKVLERVLAWYHVLTAGGESRIITRWEELSSYAYGQHVTVVTEWAELKGVTHGLSPDGGLVIVDELGTRHTVLAGEVSRTRRTTP